MKITFDPVKSARNTNERGLPFERAAEFDWTRALIVEDTRKAYPERRFVAAGYLDDRLHILCFTPISEGIRGSVFARPTFEKEDVMGKPLPLTDDQGEVRELTNEDFARMRPACDVLPQILDSGLAGDALQPRSAKRVKKLLSVRYSQEVVDFFRATGPGWQRRMDEALKEWIVLHSRG